ncbi:hypothetical protein M569_07823 [Genlisea aurea]|uniref:Splicing factor 3A subunit 1 n=1 Tax=Genlisea aurea TaxID=192259 RepID=S8DUX2_9LAMI|nr:hypothetical protein M569_07823 [Genlisea aurea]
MLSSSAILPLPAPPDDGEPRPAPPAQANGNSEDKVVTHTKAIGIIHPPTDIRNIVDTTAQFVAKNGLEFEKRIIANNEGNAKFNFLRSSDPYHGYYQHRLSEARSQNQSSAPQQPVQTSENPSESLDAALSSSDTKESSAKPDPAAQFRPVQKILEPPEPEKYTVRLPEGITGEELDIIKLTAQFAARNGKSFFTGLTSRESTNPQFHFLRPTHSMFMFFTSLTDAYSEVLMPPEGLTDKIRNSVADLTTVLERCLNRLEWERSQEQARQKAEDEIEEERQQMAMIDWHDFVVVETIDFADDEDEDLPQPMTLDEVIRRSKISATEEEEAVEPGKEVEMEMDEEEVKLVEEGMRAAALEDNGDVKSSNVIVTTSDEHEPAMRIVKSWKRPEERILGNRDLTNDYVVSPITGELIPISEMSEHMRISLIDPKYKEQKDRMFAKIRETTLAADDEISKNIVGLARTRPDIFGTTEEEVSNAVKAEIEKKKDDQPKQVIWDGHTGSIGRTASQAMSQNGVSGDAAMSDAAALNNSDGAAAPPKPGMPSVRPLPPPPGLALNIPRPPLVHYSNPSAPGMIMPPPQPQPAPGPPVVTSLPTAIRLPPPSMGMIHSQYLMPNRPPSGGAPVPPPPGSQFSPMGAPRPPFVHLPVPPQPGMLPPPMVVPHQGMMPPPPPPAEAPPPLPDEPEPKKQKLDDSDLIPEDQFLAHYSGPARIVISVPNFEEGNLRGQLVEIVMQSVGETVGSLKEKIAGEIQLPANKQKLSGKAGFLKDNLTLAYYNIVPGETLSLTLRERGGRKR